LQLCSATLYSAASLQPSSFAVVSFSELPAQMSLLLRNLTPTVSAHATRLPSRLLGSKMSQHLPRIRLGPYTPSSRNIFGHLDVPFTTPKTLGTIRFDIMAGNVLTDRVRFRPLRRAPNQPYPRMILSGL